MISLFLIIIFVQYLYSRRAHKTREHVFHCCCGTCASIIHHGGTLRSETPHRQQGHVAHNRHWTVDLSPFLLARSTPPSFSASLSCHPKHYIYKLVIRTVAHSLCFPVSSWPCPTLPPIFLFLFSSPSVLSRFLFALLLLWVSVLR